MDAGAEKSEMPANRYGTSANYMHMTEAGNASTVPTPKQADLNKMPFITGGKLFVTLDGGDNIASGSIFMRNNLLLTTAHCLQGDTT